MLIAVAVPAAPASASHPWGFPFEAGDPVRFEGSVADSGGSALAASRLASSSGVNVTSVAAMLSASC